MKQDNPIIPWARAIEPLALRDHIAIRCFELFLSNGKWENHTFPTIAENAYKAADSMLAARNALKPSGPIV